MKAEYSVCQRAAQLVASLAVATDGMSGRILAVSTAGD